MFNMDRNDIDVCHPKRGGEKVLFHKHIFKNELEARQALKDRNLSAGELAVARYYVNYNEEYSTPSYDNIRMIMAVGGASPLNNKDTYFFTDSVDVNDDSYLTLSQLNKELEKYYTKEEIDVLVEELKNIEIDTSIFATKEEVIELTNIVNNKVDASYVENYFEDNVENTVNQIIEDTNIPNIVEEEIEKQNISQKVSEEVDKKLENFEGVTTETLDEALQNNEYFTTNVITPIESITEKVNTIETQIKDLDADIDGGEEEEWGI